LRAATGPKHRHEPLCGDTSLEGLRGNLILSFVAIPILGGTKDT
jgi:hypothetical protein